MSSTNGAGASRSVSIEQAEALLRSLTGVAAARIMSGPQGKVMGVQIQASDELPPHQIARNVQSALLARFGLLIDSGLIEFVDQSPPEEREISTEPTAPGGREPRVAGVAVDGGVVGGGGIGRGVVDGGAPVLSNPPPEVSGPELVERPTVERLRPNRIRCRVVIGLAGAHVAGEAELLDGRDAALSVTARAVLDACRNADPDGAGSMELEGIRTVELAGRGYVLAGVRAVEPRNVQYLAGAAAIDAAAEEAAALATLQAVRQWKAPRAHRTR
jgi:hypothetical protein